MAGFIATEAQVTGHRLHVQAQRKAYHVVHASQVNTDNQRDTLELCNAILVNYQVQSRCASAMAYAQVLLVMILEMEKQYDQTATPVRKAQSFRLVREHFTSVV